MKTKKILITGATGFAGGHLAEYLSKKKENLVFGTYLFKDGFDEISFLEKKVKFFKINLLEKKEIKSLVKDFLPDEIYHLAALASPTKSFLNPQETLINNIVAEVNLLEIIRELELKTRILIIGSADEYGIVNKENIPIDENTPFNPTSPYSVSKIVQDLLGLQYFNSYKLNIYRARPFNHIGPRQKDNFVVASFCKQIAEIEKGKKEKIIRVGNLETIRDFTDVRDMVIAYELLLKKGKPGLVYNIGSGRGYKISKILEILLSFSKIKINVKVDSSLFRPAENPIIVADNSFFVKNTGWQPKIPLEKTLLDTLEYWRNKRQI